MDDRVRLRVDARAELGEGPIWDPASGDLLWVDILGRRVHRFGPGSDTVGPDLVTDRDVGAVAPRRSGGLVLAVAGGFEVRGPGPAPTRNLIAVEGSLPGNRMNDGKCDPAGRFWAGTMAYDETPGAGSLYRLDPDLTVTTVFRDVTVSNGLGWSPDGRTMYYTDSGTGGVDRFRYDAGTGRIDTRERWVDIAESDGVPDGSTVDAEGGVWVALWGGGAVRRYAPDGSLDRIVTLPCRLVTSCAFGGDDLDELFITTAAYGLSGPELRRQPGAGGLFSVRPGVRGLAPVPFAG